MDNFERRWLPVDGREFTERSGKWRCELDGPVNLAAPDLRTFFLRFVLVEKDPRWKGPIAAERTLQLKTSLMSFHNIDGKQAGYASWLELVIDGFLDAGKTDDVIEAFVIERPTN
jgi:hypothetical protein